jgi:acetyl esterase/lipase
MPRFPLPWFTFAIIAFALADSASAGQALDPATAKTDPGDRTQWYDIRPLGLEGQGWSETKDPFDRLPAKAQGVVRDPVWQLSRNAAGIAVRFRTEAPQLKARWTLNSERLAMPHMPATGVSGIDLYVRRDDGSWRWLAVGQPTAVTNSVTLVSGLPPGNREYLLYLPLYNGVKSVELGMPPGIALAQADAYDAAHRQPILFYGTSIAQGGCASRPGMVHTAILGRRLQRPVLNFGFSGNGRMEPEMAALFAEQDPAVYVLDCLPNMTASEVTERVEPFVQTLRKARPQTPILLVEDRSYTDSYLIPSKQQRNTESRAALRKAYERLLAAGVSGLTYLEGEHLLGDDSEGTVDSSHPTDLGFVRQADAFQPALQSLLAPAGKVNEFPPRGFQNRVYTGTDGETHKFVIFIPYKYDRAQPPPVLLFLHGSGERGDNGIDQIMVGIGPAIWKQHRTFPFVVVFPQCEIDHNWEADGANAQRALAMLEQTQRELGTDPDRVSLTGLSMGGSGTWSLAAKYPHMFAAIVPMCSNGELMDAAKLAEARLPIWNFCGDQDREETVAFNREMQAALTAAGANAKYTEYPGVKHNCWDDAYGTPELYTWLLEQSRSRNQKRP